MDSERQVARSEFVSRVAIAAFAAAILVIGLFVVSKIYQVLLLFFAATLVAIFLRTVVNALSRWTGMSKRWSLPAAVFGIILIMSAVGWLLSPSIGTEVQQLKEQLPVAFTHALEWVRDQPWGQTLIEKSKDHTVPGAAEASQAMVKVSQLFSNTFGVVAGVVIILFVGLYFAINPTAYLGLLLRLTPDRRRFATKRIMVRTGQTLRSWLVGQLICMTTIGVCIGVGLHFLGVPLAAALGFVAGLFEFVPTVGPILSAVPAVLLGFVESPTKALYVVILFVVVQFLENHTLVPLVQSRAINIPPALLIFSLLVFSTLFGFLGLFLATPLAAVIAVILDELTRRKPKVDAG